MDNENGPVVDGLRPLSDRDVPHPITIRESRYAGAYSGGEWVLVAGAQDALADTEAWGSDTNCNRFWTDRDGNPEFTHSRAGRERKCYAAAGDDPNELLKELFGYYGDSDE